MPVSHQKEWDTTLRGSIESYPVAEPVDRYTIRYITHTLQLLSI